MKSLFQTADSQTQTINEESSKEVSIGTILEKKNETCLLPRLMISSTNCLLTLDKRSTLTKQLASLSKELLKTNAP